MTKVALVAPYFEDGGGVASVVTFLAEVLEEADDFEVLLITLATSWRDDCSVRLLGPHTWLRGVRAKEVSIRGWKATHVGAPVAELEWGRYVPRGELTRRLDSCDVVQIVAGSPAWAVVAAPCANPIALQVATLASAERAAKRTGFSLHPLSIWRRLMSRGTEYIDKLGADVTDVVFVENRWMQKQMLGKSKVKLVPPGIDTNLFHPRRMQKVTGLQSKGYLLSVGRFDDPRKRVDVLVDAYVRLQRMYETPPKLVLAGLTAPPEGVWSYARKHGVRDHIEFHKAPTSEKLAELYRGATVFVLSSAEEGLGLVLLEAQASGIPVVATRTRGAETAIRDEVSGKLCPVDDAESLAESIKNLLDNPRRRRRMGSAGREYVETHFSRERTGDRFLREYRRLAGSS